MNQYDQMFDVKINVMHNKNWLDFGNLYLIVMITAVEKLKIYGWETCAFSENRRVHTLYYGVNIFSYCQSKFYIFFWVLKSMFQLYCGSETVNFNIKMSIFFCNIYHSRGNHF